MILLFTFVLSTILFLLFFVQQRYKYWKNQGVPFPDTNLFFGNITDVLFLRITLSEFLDRLYRSYTEYSYVGFYNFLTPAIVLRDPQIVNDVLIKNFDSFHDVFIKTPDDIAKINPFYSDGAKWKEIRKEIAPHVSNLKVKEMQPYIEKVCQDMIKYIENLNGDYVDAHDVTYRFTGSNVMSCAYGLEGKCFEEKYPFIFNIRDDMVIQNPRLANINHTVGLMWPNLARLLRISYFGKYIPSKFQDMISGAIKTRENSSQQQKDYLNFLKEVKEKYQDLSHFGYACVFYLDAFETSALAFTYALFELALHPMVQIKAQQEIDLIAEKYDSIFSSEAQKEMDYIDNIIFEITRKHPIIKFLNRLSIKDIQLPSPNDSGASVTIKKGTQIFIPLTAIHNDDKYYEEPDRFDPDRFTTEQRKSRPKLSYLGFGDGPRICLGREFGITQLRMGLIAILSKFNVSLDKKTILPVGESTNHISKYPKETIWIKFSPRE